MLKKGDIVTITIETLAFGGAGIGRIKQDEKSFAVFVEDTVPGDEVKIRIGGKKKQYAIGYLEELIKPSPQQIKPRCQHFSKQMHVPPNKQNCGGCSLQYLTYEDQLTIKEQHVRDAITRIGELPADLVLPILGCNEPWYYRNKMEFSFSRDKDGVLCLGLHQKRRHHDVVELTECFLMAPYIGPFVTVVRDFMREWERTTQSPLNYLQSLVIREGKNTGEVMVNLVSENGTPPFLEEFEVLVKDFFAKLPDIAQPDTKLSPTRQTIIRLCSIYSTEITNQKGQPKQISERLVWGAATINEVLYLGLENESKLALTFAIAPSAFFQPNTQQAQLLFSLARKAAALTGNEVVYDLYCGAGTIGLSCANQAAKIIGVELNPSAIENALANAQNNNITNAHFIAGNVLKVVDTFEDKPHVVMVDPPRSGLEPAVIEKIVELNPQRIVYISCNPTSLARDLKIFAQNNYKIHPIQPVDMFPQTYHIECVTSLEKIRDT